MTSWLRAGGWDYKSYVRRTHSDSYNGSLMKSLDGSREDLLADSPFVVYPADTTNGTSHLSSQCKFLYILPSEYISSSDEPEVRHSSTSSPHVPEVNREPWCKPSKYREPC
jgi:hypothetical protein